MYSRMDLPHRVLTSSTIPFRWTRRGARSTWREPGIESRRVPAPGAVPWTWKPGQSGNAAGRPPSFLDLAVSVRRITNNGTELVELLLAIARGEAITVPGRNGDRALRPQRPNLTQRMQAAQALLDRGFGKPKEVLELVGDTSAGPERQARRARLLAMTAEERAELHDLLHRASALMAPRGGLREAEVVSAAGPPTSDEPDDDARDAAA